MDQAASEDRQFLDTLEHHIRAQYLPPFGDNSFFNSGLFHYIVHDAAASLPRLDREMHSLRERFGTERCKVKMRINAERPSITFKLYTPSECRKIRITDGSIVTRPMAPDELDHEAMSDREFLDKMEHHFRAEYLPPFGDKAFFNSKLYHYMISEAGSHLERLDRQMEKLQARFGSRTHRIKMRVQTDPPAIKIKLYTPTQCRKITITDGDIQVRAMTASE